jgi:hypothetical protein
MADVLPDLLPGFCDAIPTFDAHRLVRTFYDSIRCFCGHLVHLSYNLCYANVMVGNSVMPAYHRDRQD